LDYPLFCVLMPLRRVLTLTPRDSYAAILHSVAGKIEKRLDKQQRQQHKSNV
jgi:hypothetical protein